MHPEMLALPLQSERQVFRGRQSATPLERGSLRALWVVNKGRTEEIGLRGMDGKGRSLGHGEVMRGRKGNLSLPCLIPPFYLSQASWSPDHSRSCV